ncbi:ABC transporter substrate-binding protein [bacterium]|nr:ABC transporter substrate-binding protein [bacterium]
MKKVILLFLSTFAFAQVSVAVNTKTTLVLNWKAEPEFGGFYTAQVEKIYEKNKLDAEIVQGGAGTPTVQMLAAGKVDFAIVSGDEVAIARSNGADVVALFAVFQKAPYAFMLHEKSPIKNMEELFNSGSTVAVVNGLPYVTYLEKKYGFKKIKTVPFAGGITNFLSDKNFVQQCFISSEPLVAAKQGVKTKTFLVADTGFNPYTVVMATNGKTLKNKPELVKAMVASVKAGWEAYLKDPKATHEAIAKLNSAMTMEAMSEIHKVETAFIENAETRKYGIGIMTEHRWKELLVQLNELGLLKKPVQTSEIFVKSL